ncbi:hypothetical protein A4H34_02615 [Peptidiphaga gingivicola]|uniref:Uncharacterized protein n=1 Tax=Peptidiphaga gingivicola TaxID=2741497 RepID=A0A179B313_9ACTO|nr:hypothetical protein [Peptidiphaga gingivicola]OAP86087.1 hypothetical protein A4H34_02615 [Peptidiphaga gingivicola]
MATPNADRLRAINDWNPDLIEHTNQTLGKISGRLQTIAEVNRRVAADLGIEGEAAKSASARLDELASSLRRTSTGVDKLVEVQNDFVEGGRQAQDESRAIQANLDSVNSQIDKSKSEARNTPLLGPLIEQAISGQVEQIRDNAHAKIDTHAKEVLATLDARTAAAIGALPKRFAISRIKKAARSAYQREKWAPNKPERQGSSDRRSSGHSSAPSRSATDWRVSAPPASAGTAGSYSDAGSHSASSSAGGMSLQHSHYTTPQSSALVPGSGTAAFHSSGSSSHSSAVFNPLATSAAVGGGAAVAGYKAYQAARAALAAKAAPTSKASSMRSGAAVRATSPSGSGITRGATTAVRAASSATSVGKAVPARGGATGIARPTSAGSTSTGRSGILKGATTAARTASPTSSARGSGITRGATTAVRATSSATSVGKAGSVNEGSGGTANRAGGAARGGLAARSTSSTAARTTGSARGATASGAAGRAGGSAAGRSAGSFGGARSAGMGAAGRTGGSGSTGRSASSRAIAGLTGGRRGKDKREDSRSHPIEETQVSLYEDDKTITFLEAGRREETPSDGVPA